MKELIVKIFSTDLTPNQYFLLYCLRHGISVEYNFNPTLERKNLKSKEYIDEKGNLTKKCSILDDPLDYLYHANIELEEKVLNAKAIELMQLFPLRRHGSGFARGRLSVVKERLKIFLNTYNYDWETVLRATENYVKYWSDNGFKYMKVCSNFIFADGDSTLAGECELIQHNLQMQEFGKII